MRAGRRPSGSVGPTLTGLQVEGWRVLWEELLRDPGALAEFRDWEVRRREARPPMRHLLDRFVAGAIDVEQLRAEFDRGTRAQWDAFALKGAAGAMYLNQLVKHLAARDLGSVLRAALPAPPDDGAARVALRRAVDAVHALAARAQLAPGLLPATRTVFFVTAWWHVQDTERWPGFQPSARQALRRDLDAYRPTGEAVTDYFAFRDAFLALAAALKLTSWELEFLCWWQAQRDEQDDPSELEPARLRPVPRRGGTTAPLALVRGAAVVPPPPPSPEAPSPEHTHVQWLLATIGRRLGCRVWVAPNDRGRVWAGETLGSLSLRRLPRLGMRPESERIVSHIDVLWLRGLHQVAAAFEVEHTTSIYSGLLRLADLAALSPNLSFPLYIATPRDRLDRVRRELERPAFQALGLHRRAAFFSSEALIDSAESIMRWATDPAAIERLATRAGDVLLDEPSSA